ncbi:Veg family protein [Enterococcus songbeiensis]|uniref:Veg family protein n=1 Tax=Enterococcus songbeiensis TaxID=2559927 RepID=UPI0035316EEF
MLHLKFSVNCVIITFEVNAMPTTLASIKKDLECRIGSEIMLVAQTGRKRQTERRGVLTETYPSVFVVDLDQEENSFERVSYSYSDVLTRTVEIEFLSEAI